MSCGKLAKIRWISTFFEWNVNFTVFTVRSECCVLVKKKKKSLYTKGANVIELNFVTESTADLRGLAVIGWLATSLIVKKIEKKEKTVNILEQIKAKTLDSTGTLL